MADNFSDMVAFVHVVEAGSLSGAASRSQPFAGGYQSQTGAVGGAAGRSTRKSHHRTLALTDEGAAFHARCVRILAEIDEAETEVTQGRDKAIGLLKITSTFAFGRATLPL